MLPEHIQPLQPDPTKFNQIWPDQPDSQRLTMQQDPIKSNQVQPDPAARSNRIQPGPTGSNQIQQRPNQIQPD